MLRSDVQCRQLYAFLRANWTACAQAEKPLAVTVAEHKSKRSDEQNRLYWAVLNEIADGAWWNGKKYAADIWHEQFKRLFIGLTELPSGENAGISTTSLSVGEFSDYIERVRAYAADELGVEVALP